MLANGKSIIQFESLSEDVENILQIANQLCTNVEIIGNKIHIEGGIINKQANINVGESGLGLRMLIPILSAIGNKYTISGCGSLLNRPVDFILENLKQTGAILSSNNGQLPITISGRMTQNQIQIDASTSSQLLTGLLMAAPLLESDVCINVANLKSKPYIDLTISVLNEFGIEVVNCDYRKFIIRAGQKYQPVNVKAEGDWSGAAFILVAAAIAGEVEITGISKYSKQGDKQIVDILKQVGAVVKETDNSVFVSKNNLDAFEFDATDTPDLFPPLVALAVNCSGISKIKGVSRLLHKESNRAVSLKSEFEKLSAKISLSDDYMFISGGQLHGNTVNSHNDHRVAMALATAAITINEAVAIENSEAIAKSWSEFFYKFAEIGLAISN